MIFTGGDTGLLARSSAGLDRSVFNPTISFKGGQHLVDVGGSDTVAKAPA